MSAPATEMPAQARTNGLSHGATGGGAGAAAGTGGEAADIGEAAGAARHAAQVLRQASSAGALLRAARERQGMHIATLAAAIKVAPRKLEALEQDRWDELPGPTFTRALAQAVCRALKADPAPVMDLLPAADTSMLDSSFGTINEPFAGKGEREPGLRGFVPRGPWLIAAIVLLAAAALLMWLPSGTWSRLVSRAAAPAVDGPGPASTTAPVASLPPTGAMPVPGGSPGVPGTAAATAAVPEAAAPRGAAGATAEPSPAAASAAAVVPLPAGELVFQCSGRSWIEVVDAQARVLVSRNLEAGESLGIDGPAPLQVVVGNAEATQVLYKGRPVDMTARTRDNVARFELR